MILDIVEAIYILRPNAEWVIQGDNYSGLQWLDKKQTQPTFEEIEAKIAELPQIEAQAKATKAATKAALLEKLGITEDEARLLLS